MSEEATGASTLARRLGVFDATMIVMGGIIGSGIFMNPSVVAREVAIDLRRRDRKTQLADFSKVVLPFFQLMRERVHQWGEGLSKEGCVLGISHFLTRNYPSDIERPYEICG